MAIRGIAIDLEGTIVDVEEAHHAAHLSVAKDLGLLISRDQAIGLIPGFVGGGDDAVADGLRRLSRTDTSAAAILTRIKERYLESLRSASIAPRPGFLERFEQMRMRGLPVAIGSLTPQREARYLIERAGLSQIFNGLPMVFREDVTRVKPDPEVFERTAAILGIPASMQLVLEDSPPGIRAAVAAGSRAVAILAIDVDSVRQALVAAGAFAVLRNWDELNLDDVL